MLWMTSLISPTEHEEELSKNVSSSTVASVINLMLYAERAFLPVTTKELNRNGIHDEFEIRIPRNVMGVFSLPRKADRT